MRVKPNPNKEVGGEKLKVFDPVRREFLPETGRDVQRTAYWIRRLQTGDVVLDDGSKPEKTETKPAAQAPKNNNSAKTSKKSASKKAAAKTKTAKKEE